jgi:hypothetical protein
LCARRGRQAYALQLEDTKMRTKPASLIPHANIATPPAPPPVEMREAKPIRWFRVKDGPAGNNPGTVGPFRRPSGDFFVKKGKVLNSGEYDVESMTNGGAIVEEIPAPGWYVKHQKQSADKVEQLHEAGVQVGDSADYVPTPLAGSAA